MLTRARVFRRVRAVEDSERLPRKLAAILYADVAGYSRLTGEDEDATHRKLSEYLDLISGTVGHHRGRVMHYAGDAVLAMFDAVVDALTCATAIQESLKGRSDESAENRRLEFRIGLNLGDVIEDRGDIYGDGVNIAARLEMPREVVERARELRSTTEIVAKLGELSIEQPVTIQMADGSAFDVEPGAAVTVEEPSAAP